MVFFNTKFESFTTAAQNAEKDSLAVVAVMVDAVDGRLIKGDPLFQFVENIDAIIESGSSFVHNYNNSLSFDDLFPTMFGYFTFQGSLTTPPCSENVLWLVFERTKRITTQELNAFRTIHDAAGEAITENRRELQSTNGRPVASVARVRYTSEQCTRS